MSLDGQLGELFGALSDSYRRQLLVGLLEHDPQDDHGIDPLDLISESGTADALELHLIHTHLPKLESEGFIEWDQEAGKIRKGPNWDTIEPTLQILHEHRVEIRADWTDRKH